VQADQAVTSIPYGEEYHVWPSAAAGAFDWYSSHDWRIAYPGDPKIYLPDQVPGRNLPAAFLGDD
jgi:hypothetical protein